MAETRNTSSAPAKQDAAEVQKQLEEQQKKADKGQEQEGTPSEPVEPDAFDTVMGNANIAGGTTEEQGAYVPDESEKQS